MRGYFTHLKKDLANMVCVVNVHITHVLLKDIIQCFFQLWDICLYIMLFPFVCTHGYFLHRFQASKTPSWTAQRVKATVHQIQLSTLNWKWNKCLIILREDLKQTSEKNINHMLLCIIAFSKLTAEEGGWFLIFRVFKSIFVFINWI